MSNRRYPVDDLVGDVADAIGVCWIISQGSDGLVQDTFESLMDELKRESLLWCGDGARVLAETLQVSEDEIWRRLGTCFGAVVERPLGVLTFDSGQNTVSRALKRKDGLRMRFPSLISCIEDAIPSLAAVAFKDTPAFSA